MTRRMHVGTMAAALMLSLAACQGTRDAAPDTGVAGSTTSAAAAGGTAGATGAAAAAIGGRLLDPNNATRDELLAVQGMPGHVVDAIVAGRPFEDMRAVDQALASHVPDTTARRALYNHVWKPIDLNTASGDEILLIPGVGPRMRHEFEEYRPYRSLEQFRREIGKYVDRDEVARLERYVTIR